MGIFDKIKEPVFLKDDSNATTQLNSLQELAKVAKGQLAEQLELEIKCISAGIYGEETIRFELQNSHIPMFVLHDLYLEHGELSAQIDYLIITRRKNYVIECKNLFGNIEINSNGDFIRTISYGRYTKKEGLYSPITQNRRHLELIKQIRSDTQSNVISKVLFEKFFYDNYRSLVVLANPKTILNSKYAKKEVKEQVIRADQLIQYIRKTNSDPQDVNSSEKDMESLARFFLNCHKPLKIDYTEKFRTQMESLASESIPSQSTAQAVCPKCGSAMVLRKVSKGANIGNEFWGCSTFPKCRGVADVTSGQCK